MPFHPHRSVKDPVLAKANRLKQIWHFEAKPLRRHDKSENIQPSTGKCLEGEIISVSPKTFLIFLELFIRQKWFRLGHSKKINKPRCFQVEAGLRCWCRGMSTFCIMLKNVGVQRNKSQKNTVVFFPFLQPKHFFGYCSILGCGSISRELDDL